MKNVGYDVLSRANVVSKTKQNTSEELPTAVSLTNNVSDYVTNCRANGYERALESAKQLATELDVKINFKRKRIRRKKRLFEYESTDEVSNACEPEKCFKNHGFNVIIDSAINSLSERFEQLKRFYDIWEFFRI